MSPWEALLRILKGPESVSTPRFSIQLRPLPYVRLVLENLVFGFWFLGRRLRASHDLEHPVVHLTGGGQLLEDRWVAVELSFAGHRQFSQLGLSQHDVFHVG